MKKQRTAVSVAGGLAALAAAASLAPAPLYAQASNNAPPAERMTVSPGGVDMRSGRYAYDQTDLAIGGGEGGRLSLARTLAQQVPGHANPFGNFSHNWEILLNEKRIDLLHNIYAHEPGRPDFQIEIAYGGLSQTFRANGAQNYGFEQISRAGFGMLTSVGDREGAGAVYSFTAGDGTQAMFRPIGSADCSTLLRCAAVAQIVQPDGTRLDFGYDDQGSPNTTRLRSVTSSRGYALLLEYDGALVVKACLLNLAVTPKPANNLCPAGAQAVSTYTYATVSGQPLLASATDAAGAASTFTNPALGTIGFVRPGETQPWLVNHGTQIMDEEGATSEIVSSQSFADGSSYSYTYDATPFVPNQQQKIAGGSYVDNLGNRTTLRYDFPVLPRPGAGGGNVPGNDEDPQPVTYQVTPGPVEITDPLGRVSRVDYCDAHAMANLAGLNRCIVMPMPISVTDPEGIRTRLVTDMFSRNVLERRQVAKAGSALPDIVARATYSCIPATARYCNKPLTRTDARNAVTDYSYAPEHGGVLTETGPAPAPGAPRPQTRHLYAQRSAWIANGGGGFTPAAAPVWVRVATSSCRTGAATGNPASPCALAGDEVRIDYDYGPNSGPNNLLPRGQTVMATDSGVTTTLRTCYGYDTHGRRIAEAQPNAALASCPAALPGGAPFTSYTRYDAAGRVTGTIAPDPAIDGNPFPAVRNSYDLAGRLTKVETGTLSSWQSDAVAPTNWTTFAVLRTLETQYDAMSRKTRDTFREGAVGPIRTVTQYSYDGAGQLECTAVRMNPALFGVPPASACTPGAAGNDGPDRITRIVYDAANQRLQLREGVGTGDEGTEATWAYNLNGQIAAVIDGNGNRAELRYDGHGRQDRWTFPSPARAAAYDDSTQATALATAGSVNAADYEEYTYDPNGNRTSLTKRDGSTLAFAYDALNRVTVKSVTPAAARAGTSQALTAAQVRPVYYAYDLRGLQIAARFTSQTGEGVSNAYDGFGRLASSSTDMDGVTRTLTYQYDRDGNRTHINHPAPYGATFSIGYDGLDRPITLHGQGLGWLARAYRGPHGGLIDLSRISTTSHEWNATETIFYDGLQRPSSRVRNWYWGGLVAWTYQRNAAGQLASVGRDNDAYAWTGHYGVQRPYTTNGLNQYSGAGGTALAYDGNGNLISETPPSPNPLRTYTYDVENRLVAVSNGAALRYDPLGRLYQVSLAGNVTRFLYDGDALVAEYNAAGTMTRRYVHWAGVDVPFMDFAGSDFAAPRYLFADHQGSIVSAVDASGATTYINAYDEYGIPGAANAGRFQFTGQAWLAEIGMYHYKARVYSPTLGRFLQTDPIGYDDQFNLYAYVGNDPGNGSDPTGTSCVPVPGTTTYYCEVDFVMESDGNRRLVNNTDLERLAPVNATYTAAVNGLIANQERAGSIPDLEGALGGFRIGARDVATSLIRRQVTFVDQNTDRGALLVTQGLPDENGRVPWAETIVTRDGLAATDVDWVHDGMHSTDQEASGGLLNARYPLVHIPHDEAYDSLSCRLLGRRSNCAD